MLKISFRSSGVLESVDMPGNDDGKFVGVYDIATLPGGGLAGVAALDRRVRCFQVFAEQNCVAAAAHGLDQAAYLQRAPT